MERNTAVTVLLCFLAYTSAYMGRLNYSAIMHVLLPSLGADKALGGLVASAFFFCYGAGQLVNGLLCKRYNAKKAIFVGLVVSVAVNLVFAVVSNIVVMIVLWAVNGLFQSLLWCNIVRILSTTPQKTYAKSAVVLSATLPIGTLLAYGLASLCIYLNNWRVLFLISAIIMAVVATLWMLLLKPATTTQSTEEQSKQKGSKGFYILFGFFAVSAISCGFIRDGIVSWTPSLLKEVHSTPEWLATVLTLSLPLVALLGVFVAQVLTRAIKNHCVVMAICYALAGVVIVLLMFVYSHYVSEALILLALVACLMASVNNLITLIIPLYFKNTVNSGMLAGVLNTFCYIGSTASVFGLGAVIDGLGWNAYYNVLFIATVVATIVLICAVVYNRLKKIGANNEN